ncbi:thiolase family protein [Parafrankia sp. BMG5.11]|uniref:thiolase family protein n=2 Tax=unclassified Parafrankia TaxID=2994368 RepID=UPI00103CD578|nr:thiolase family protein [Parafrankia sp. BMG5.11]TCJ31868.1 thiolase family protein [Parafrankia sp. BMG5.11]
MSADVMNIERRAIVSGIGRSASGRRLNRPAIDLTLDACLAAIADAGLTPRDIDGLTSWPDHPAPHGFGGPRVGDLHTLLRLDLSWILGCGDGANVIGILGIAAHAVATGLARHVLVYRTVGEATSQGTGRRPAVMAGPGAGAAPWKATYGVGSPVQFAALWAQHHFDRYGTTREQLGWVAVNDRRNAADNPDAIYRDPMTIDDYLAARMISEPLCLFDCDIPADGSIAFVVSHADHRRDVDRPVFFEALGGGRPMTSSWEFWPDFDVMAATKAAEQLWSRTSLRPADVDVAGLYDGFSIFVLLWLEALGFCGRGEAGPFVEGGTRIARTGDLPLNTSGGQLSEGRYLGFGLAYETFLQLREQAGARQVAGAEVGLVTGGGGPLAQAFLFTSDR